MNPSYFDLLSPEPIRLENVGGILSPTLRDIASIGYDTYQYYLAFLTMDLKSYLEMIGQEEAYLLLSQEGKTYFNIFDLFLSNRISRDLLGTILNFFLQETVVLSRKEYGFIVQDQSAAIGIITRENFSLVCDLICRRNYISPGQKEDLSGIKSKKVLDIMKKLQKGRSEKAKLNKADRNMEIGNIISAVANKSPSLNIHNIWELTVYQLWDCFARLSHNTIYDIQSMSVAAWGDKEHHFDAASWYKRMDTGN